MITSKSFGNFGCHFLKINIRYNVCFLTSTATYIMYYTYLQCFLLLDQYQFSILDTDKEYWREWKLTTSSSRKLLSRLFSASKLNQANYLRQRHSIHVVLTSDSVTRFPTAIVNSNMEREVTLCIYWMVFFKVSLLSWQSHMLWWSNVKFLCSANKFGLQPTPV